jgi:2-keto-3-deoxy-L-rhamnonate aldolase RhmA
MVPLKKRLEAGDLVVGTMLSEVRNPNVVNLLAESGFDFVIVDNEHGTYSAADVSNLVAAARGADISVIVRIPEIRRETILKPLDSGATGLLIPQVETADQARQIIHHAKYPPKGQRGLAMRRAHSLYGRPDAAEYLRQANEDTLIVVQAESQTAIDNLDQIIAVEGIDAIFVGPFDLSVSLGIPGEVTHPKETEAIDKVVQICLQHKTISGIQLFDRAQATQWIAKGMRLISYSCDVNMLADAAAKDVAELKKGS